MHCIMWTYSQAIVLAGLLVISQSYAMAATGMYPFCTTDAVVSRVCAAPASDDSGSGIRFDDFGGLETKISRDARKVTPEAYARFVRVFQAVVESYGRITLKLPA